MHVQRLARTRTTDRRLACADHQKQGILPVYVVQLVKLGLYMQIRVPSYKYVPQAQRTYSSTHPFDRFFTLEFSF